MVHDDDSVLMPMRVKIFRLRGLGYSQAEIANRISVSQQTVSYYLRLMKSKSDLIGPDKYFRSLLPYLSDKLPVIPAEVRDEIWKELHEKLEMDRNSRMEEMDLIIKFEQKNQEGIKILKDELTKLSELVNNSDVNIRR